MAEQKLKARDKTVQKITKDGLVEKNLAEKTTVRVSNRARDIQMSPKGQGKELDITARITDAERGFLQGRHAENKARDAPLLTKKRTRKIIREKTESDISVKNEDRNRQQKSSRGKLQEKHVDLAQVRGDSRKKQTGGSKKPARKHRLKFTYEETPESIRGEAETEKVNRLDPEGINFRHENQKNQNKKSAFSEEEKKKKLKKHSVKGKVYLEQEVTDMPDKNNRLKFNGKPGSAKKAVGAATTAASAAVHRRIRENEDDNAAVDGANSLEEATEGIYRLKQNSSRRKNQRKARATGYQTKKEVLSAADEYQKKSRNNLKKLIQKQRIKREYAKAKRAEQATGTAAVGTIDYIKKIGGKVTNFFKEHRKVYLSMAAIVGLLFLLMTSVSSCSSAFMQSVISYAGTSYISSDEAILQADLYYTQLEANLQERINQMEEEEPGHEEYRYNIGPIEHDPFVLISYLSAKYEEFTFEQVKPELDTLFALQYQLETEAVQETVTETTTVRVGESLGNVVTSGYCNCPICCGVWSGGPTASGVYPTANHTLAVDASDPFVPIGTKVVMNGIEYTVEDTGAFARYGVQFDVYYDNHAAASAHGHQTWECFLADDNGSQEVEVTRIRDVDVLNVTLNTQSLMSLCQNRLGIFQKELFQAYNETKGNLQMFGSPFDFNWYSNVSSYFGYRIHPISNENQMHNGLDIGVPEGTEIKAGLTGTVTTAAYNESYGNYVIIQDSRGYELRYAHLQSIHVSNGSTVTKGDVIGLAGSTGNSTGSHLHVEVLKNGERLNPVFYLETGEGSVFGGNEYTSEAAQRLLEEAARYLGTPYVWGGYSPSGFDCSGFVSYCLTNSGARNTGRLTAQGLYDMCTPVSESDVQPGDLIFFTGTYNAGVPVTHVGIYVGDGQMIHCGDPIQYTSIYSSYWQSHFYGFGRW